MPGDYPTVTPYLYYEDAAAAMDWLVKAFGFEERMRMVSDQGRVEHGELDIGDGVVMVGQPGSSYENPNKREAVARPPESTSTSTTWTPTTSGRRPPARRSTTEPTDQRYGDRRYHCEDLHRFAPLRGTHFFGVRRKGFLATLS